MPRSNPDRSINAERVLAQRIVAERDARGWTNDGLARRMTEAGCPIRDSAIYKIEKGEPPRRITVDELAGFATVFGLPVVSLLQDPARGSVPERTVESIFELERAFRRHVQLQHELDELARRRDTLFSSIKDTVTVGREEFEGFREWVSSDWDNWPEFLEWSKIAVLLKSTNPKRKANR